MAWIQSNHKGTVYIYLKHPPKGDMMTSEVFMMHPLSEKSGVGV